MCRKKKRTAAKFAAVELPKEGTHPFASWYGLRMYQASINSSILKQQTAIHDDQQLLSASANTQLQHLLVPVGDVGQQQSLSTSVTDIDQLQQSPVGDVCFELEI